jgi:hypothetical protein
MHLKVDMNEVTRRSTVISLPKIGPASSTGGSGDEYDAQLPPVKATLKEERESCLGKDATTTSASGLNSGTRESYAVPSKPKAKDSLVIHHKNLKDHKEMWLHDKAVAQLLGEDTGDGGGAHGHEMGATDIHVYADHTGKGVSDGTLHYSASLPYTTTGAPGATGPTGGNVVLKKKRKAAVRRVPPIESASPTAYGTRTRMKYSPTESINKILEDIDAPLVLMTRKDARNAARQDLLTRSTNAKYAPKSVSPKGLRNDQKVSRFGNKLRDEIAQVAGQKLLSTTG